MKKVLIMALLLGLPCAFAIADTIILKNGTRIETLGTWEEGDEIKYFIRGGIADFPKEDVERIEEGEIENKDDTNQKLDESPLKTKPISYIDAKRIVKSLPCSKGGTIDNHLRNKTKSPAVKDLGWSVQRSGNQFIVEKTIDVGFSSHTIFRWSVDTEGIVKPSNGYAIGITKQKKIPETIIKISRKEGFSSGALGLSRQFWDSQHKLSKARSGFFLYEGLRYVVGYQNGNICDFERNWGETGISKQQAMIEIIKMIPSDSKFIKSYSAPYTRNTVYLYFSESLISRFPKTIRFGNNELPLWTGGEPGNFIVIFNEKRKKVTRVVIAIGNNP